MRQKGPSLIASVIEAPRAATRFHDDELVEDGYGNGADGRGYVSAYVIAYGSVRLAHANVYARARDCGARVAVRCHWCVVRRRVVAHYCLYYVSHLHFQCAQTQSLFQHPSARLELRAKPCVSY
jgi:hypothetical protein